MKMPNDSVIYKLNNYLKVKIKSKKNNKTNMNYLLAQNNQCKISNTKNYKNNNIPNLKRINKHVHLEMYHLAKNKKQKEIVI